jgi:hypothetical protein
MVRATSRLPWTEEEDQLLVEAVKKGLPLHYLLILRNDKFFCDTQQPLVIKTPRIGAL